MSALAFFCPKCQRELVEQTDDEARALFLPCSWCGVKLCASTRGVFVVEDANPSLYTEAELAEARAAKEREEEAKRVEAERDAAREARERARMAHLRALSVDMVTKWRELAVEKRASYDEATASIFDDMVEVVEMSFRCCTYCDGCACWRCRSA